MTPLEQKALSIRYSNITVLVTPLGDDNFAVFARDFSSEHMQITTSEGLVQAILSRSIIQLSKPIEVSPEAARPSGRLPRQTLDVELTMEDIL